MNATASTSRLTPPTSPVTMSETSNHRRSISNSFRNILPTNNARPSLSSSRRESQRRRSIAHRPALLGLSDDEDEFQRFGANETDWHDVELEFDVERDSTSNHKSRRASGGSQQTIGRESIQLSHLPSKYDNHDQEENHYRIDDDQAFEPQIENGYHTHHQYGNKEVDDDDDLPQEYTSSSVYTRLTGTESGEQGERTTTTTRSLDFEALDKSEKWSYWIVTFIVLILSAVAVGIGSDWIDWPGDGIGKD